ncbi:MAG: Sir2 silent information regulator family NAD-dependent deacetylase, partial [Acetatifactor sp.]|nr:Sir2 silent information regulator family NAD-dependent deacetylase [Acetatifactor sp.]
RRIPSELLTVGPHCGKPLTMNLRSDNRFVEDEGWHRAAARYEDFLRAGKGRKLLFLELGVGYNTPGIIKYPFWQMTAANPKAVYACVNYGDAACPDEIRGQSVCINEDIGKVLGDLG